MYFFAISVSVVITVVAGMYSKGDGVVELTPSNFDREVLQSDNLWLVEFYAPWCGHCQSLAPEWKKAAKALQGAVKIGAVNADDHQSLGGQYGVRGFPTIKMFGLNKRQAEDYQGGRTAQSIVDTAMAKLQSMVKDRMRGKGGSSGGSGGGGGGKSADPDAAIELTDSNFEELVLKSKDLWMVEFFAPWCGHCKNLAPHWASAATEMKGKAKFGVLDATIHTVMASRYGVQGYPTIKMFPAGSKESGPEDYDGGRTSSDIVRWVDEKLAENLPAPEVVQITSAEVLKANCQERPLCVVAILPHILDCQSKCRNKYLDILRSVGDNNKKKQWGWIWAEAMAQPDLEQNLGMGGFGYPAMVAINTKKQMYIVLKGPFSEKGIGEFIRDLTYGRGSKGEYKKDEIASIEKTEPWDGKDGELPVEEDIDLDDVVLDDLDKDEL